MEKVTTRCLHFTISLVLFKQKLSMVYGKRVGQGLRDEINFAKFDFQLKVSSLQNWKFCSEIEKSIFQKIFSIRPFLFQHPSSSFLVPLKSIFELAEVVAVVVKESFASLIWNHLSKRRFILIISFKETNYFYTRERKRGRLKICLDPVL